MPGVLPFTAALFAAIFFALPASAEVRVALVVGNGDYAHTTQLTNPLNDARDMTRALKAHGFDIVEAIDADKAKFDLAIRSFAGRLSNADVALFFYAGHGLQVGLQNHLVPIDAKLGSERDLEFETVKLESILRQMEIDRDGKTSIVLLDACRDNPLSRNLARSMGTRSTAIGRGLASAPAGLGTFIAYATQPGNVALDGQGRNSPFTAAVVKHLPTPGRNLPALLIEVRKDVVAATNGQQVPWDHSAMTADFFFKPGVVSPGATAAPAAAAVATAPSAAAATIPPVQSKAALAARSVVRFETNDNVRLDGRVISSSRQPNPDACRTQCEANPLCLGYQHGRKMPVMGQCQIFDRIDARGEDLNWRSGVKQGS